MKSDILKEKGIVEKIISDLSVYADIPNNGFLAGGAVANLLMKYVWGESYPINDLDIFTEDDVEPFTIISTPQRTNSLIVEGDGYMVTKLSYDYGSTYFIKDVKRDGMINTISITKVSNRDIRNEYDYILNGFDFNCCQVGIDLQNNKLFYTSEFESFLNYKQLEVTAIYTPAHTAIRLFKKIDELKCYCNVDECMELLSQPLILQNSAYLGRNKFGIYFSTKYRDMYMKYYTQIKEYFRMEKFFDHQKERWYMRNQLESTIPNEHTLSFLDPKKSIPQHLLTRWAKNNGIMWTLVPKKYSDQNNTITEILTGLSFNPLTVINAYKIVSNKLNKKLREKANKIFLGNFYFSKMLAIVNDKFYDCDFDEKHIELVEKFIDQERWVLMVIAKDKLNLQESYELVSNIKKILNKEGEWVVELISKYLETKNRAVKPTYENISFGIKKEKEKYAVSLITPFNLENFAPIEGVTIKELTSELDLRWAGRKMNNCMNNPGQAYASKIRSGKTKLFVIITDNNMSGMEIHLVQDTVFQLQQLLSYCNKQTSEYHNVISSVLLNYINTEHLREIYESKMSSFKSIDLLNRGMLMSLKDEKTDQNQTGSFPLAYAVEEALGELGRNMFADDIQNAPYTDNNVYDGMEEVNGPYEEEGPQEMVPRLRVDERPQEMAPRLRVVRRF
jgi:hypothetical protein